MSGYVAAQATASEPLRRFFQVARGAGLRVSAAEGIDAARAVDLVGFADRMLLKDTLSLILAKTPDEKQLYEEAFELYFKRDAFTGATDGEDDDDQEHADGQAPNRGPQAGGDGIFVDQQNLFAGQGGGEGGGDPCRPGADHQNMHMPIRRRMFPRRRLGVKALRGHQTASRPRANSAIRSSGCSSPTERRIVPSVIPLASRRSRGIL